MMINNTYLCQPVPDYLIRKDKQEVSVGKSLTKQVNILHLAAFAQFYGTLGHSEANAHTLFFVKICVIKKLLRKYRSIYPHLLRWQQW